MSKHYRIVFECYESSPEAQQILSKTVMMAGSVDKPEDVFNFGFAHEEQIKLVHSCQDALLKEQITLIESVVDCCPNCPDRNLRKHGKRLYDYHDVFTDHKLTIIRKRCPDCGYEPGSTIKNFLDILCPLIWLNYKRSLEPIILTAKVSSFFQHFPGQNGSLITMTALSILLKR